MTRSVPGIRQGCFAVARLVVAMLAVTVASACLATGSASALDAAVVFTQVPRSVKAPSGDWTPGDLGRADWFGGARLMVLAPDGSMRVLSPGFNSACDPNVSFDGRRVLFAGRKEPGSRWQIWEIGLDGSGLRAVTPETMDARSPIHVSTLFTLDSPQPWFTLVFVGRESTVNELGRPSASSLYNIKLDGGELRRLTFNPNHNFDPFQMWDGRVVYSAERYPNQPGKQTGRVGLYAIHVEGADMELYGGELGGPVQHMPCATGGGLVIFVEPQPGTQDGAGQLACVEEARPHVTYRRLTRNASHVFLHPSPLRGNEVLVSRRSTRGTGTCGVFRFDANSGRCEAVFDSPDYHDVQAVLAGPRAMPDGHSTVVETKAESGIFYGLNCHDADPRMAPHLTNGLVKRVRFVEGVLRRAASATLGASPPASFVPRRLVGEAPVEADGSFNVEVPADIPLLLQTLDERGLALASCGWIWVKPKEKRGCIGCHEDPERIPENDYVQALRRPSNRLVLPADQRRTVSFREDIAPLLKKHCATAGCHGGKDTPLHLPLAAGVSREQDLEKAYSALMAPAVRKPKGPAELPQAGKYVDAGRARTSWLIWQLAGADTSRPWDHADEAGRDRARKVKAMPPVGKGEPLSPVELRTFIQWIDLGAPYEALKNTGAPGVTHKAQAD